MGIIINKKEMRISLFTAAVSIFVLAGHTDALKLAQAD